MEATPIPQSLESLVQVSLNLDGETNVLSTDSLFSNENILSVQAHKYIGSAYPIELSAKNTPDSIELFDFGGIVQDESDRHYPSILLPQFRGNYFVKPEWITVSLPSSKFLFNAHFPGNNPRMHWFDGKQKDPSTYNVAFTDYEGLKNSEQFDRNYDAIIGIPKLANSKGGEMFSAYVGNSISDMPSHLDRYVLCIPGKPITGISGEYIGLTNPLPHK